MLFNSVDFFIFLLIVFCLYWFVVNKNLRHQNILLITAGYVFYGWWDWRFLSLILFSSTVDYILGLKIDAEKRPGPRKHLLWISLLTNLGFLGFFKYYNFFIDSFVEVLSAMGFVPHVRTLNVILPVGISFYTFQSLSYTIDVYRGKATAIKDPVVFFAYVSFFPQLIAGPIERATHLLPQFSRSRVFDYELAREGILQILWGLFRKIVIADNCAQVVDQIFEDPSQYGGSDLFLGMVLFAFQIYGDFSGYSEIAIGTAKLFRFQLMKNFDFPYFSTSISDFWHRWHISLSTWFRDYVYIPLGGSRGSTAKRIRNIILTFVLSGLWHGANMTFILWGLLHGLFYIPSIILSGGLQVKTKSVMGQAAGMIITFLLVTFAWVLFRSEDMAQASLYYRHMFSLSLFAVPSFAAYGMKKALILVAGFVAIEAFQKNKEHVLDVVFLPTLIRRAIYLGVAVIVFTQFRASHTFIYFQF